MLRVRNEGPPGPDGIIGPFSERKSLTAKVLGRGGSLHPLEIDNNVCGRRVAPRPIRTLCISDCSVRVSKSWMGK